MKRAFHPLLWLALCALAAFRVHAEAAVSVVLRPNAEVVAQQYTLADIADIWTGDEAVQQKLAGIAIGVTPRIGYSQVITRQQVEEQVKRELPGTAINWAGAAQVKVRGRGQQIGQDALADVAAQALYATLAGKYTTLELQPVAEGEGISVPSGNYRLSARVPAPQVLSRRMSALVDVQVDGRLYATVPVWFSVHASRPGLVARGPIPTGESLRADQFRVQNVPLGEQSADALPPDTRFEQLRARRNMDAGGVLTAAVVESRPAVNRNDRVAVRVVSGAVTIETSGVALADARMGELIKVKTAQASEPITARVVGDGVVAVVPK
jgi:flagella basal body P-ring formation protein FlgA